MYNKILIAVDGSESNNIAVDQGSPKEPYVTVFTQSMEEEGRLSLEISMPPGKWDAGRSFELRFEGIFSGELIMHVCGERRPVKTRRCGGLRAEFALHSGENAALELHWKPETPRERFERELLQLLIRLPQNNMYKEKELPRSRVLRIGTAVLLPPPAPPLPPPPPPTPCLTRPCPLQT